METDEVDPIRSDRGRFRVARVAFERREAALEPDLVGIDFGYDEFIIDRITGRPRRLRPPVVDDVAEDIDFADTERPVRTC